MKMPIPKSTSQLINTIDWIIAKNRKTLPISDVELLENVKFELIKLTNKRTQVDSAEIKNALTEITRKLLRFFIDNGFSEWVEKLN